MDSLTTQIITEIAIGLQNSHFVIPDTRHVVLSQLATAANQRVDLNQAEKSYLTKVIGILDNCVPEPRK